jgi:DNA-binding MarR family transcriptional regulator
VLTWRRIMDATFFALKRAFHGTLRITRASLAGLGLTAARFDLLYALPHGYGRFAIRTRQSALRQALGVSRPTVSRMLASLEELGLVRRVRDTADRRQRVVTLTQRGCTLIRKAVRVFIDSGWTQLALDRALDEGVAGRRWSDEAHCIFATEALEGFLERIRAAFGDFATLAYPSHPDD